MKTTKSKRSTSIRLRLTVQERQMIDAINSSDYTNVSEHVRRSLLYYASVYYPSLLNKNLNP
jgi:hypothetical protein